MTSTIFGHVAPEAPGDVSRKSFQFNLSLFCRPLPRVNLRLNRHTIVATRPSNNDDLEDQANPIIEMGTLTFGKSISKQPPSDQHAKLTSRNLSSTPTTSHKHLTHTHLPHRTLARNLPKPPHHLHKISPPGMPRPPPHHDAFSLPALFHLPSIPPRLRAVQHHHLFRERPPPRLQHHQSPFRDRNHGHLPRFHGHGLRLQSQ